MGLKKLEVQALRHLEKFIVGDTQIPFGVGDTFVIEFMHDERQIHSIHTGMVSPGFPQTMGAVISSQPNLFADRNDELPGLTSLDGCGVTICLGVEKYKVIGFFGNAMIGFQIFAECLPNAPIDDNFMSLVAFLLFDPKPLPDPFVVFDEMTNTQLQ